jgi:hypothetical protein
MEIAISCNFVLIFSLAILLSLTVHLPYFELWLPRHGEYGVEINEKYGQLENMQKKILEPVIDDFDIDSL